MELNSNELNFISTLVDKIMGLKDIIYVLDLDRKEVNDFVKNWIKSYKDKNNIETMNIEAMDEVDFYIISNECSVDYQNKILKNKLIFRNYDVDVAEMFSCKNVDKVKKLAETNRYTDDEISICSAFVTEENGIHYVFGRGRETAWRGYMIPYDHEEYKDKDIIELFYEYR